MVVVADGLGFTFPAREDLAAVAAHADIIVRDALIEILNHMLCRKIRHRLIKRIENLTFDMSSHVVKGAEVDGGQQVFNVGDEVAGDAASAEVVDDVAAAEVGAQAVVFYWTKASAGCWRSMEGANGSRVRAFVQRRWICVVENGCVC